MNRTQLNSVSLGPIQSNADPRDEVFSYNHQFDDKPSLSKSEDRKEYNIGVLRHLQVIFGHLASSRLQYYVPRGFWKQFRSVETGEERLIYLVWEEKDG